MSGSRIAGQILNDIKKKEYYKKRQRATCIIDNKKQCQTCIYRRICDNCGEDKQVEIQN